jgi:hypothetical protein
MRAVIFMKPQSLIKQLPVRLALWLAGSLAALTLSAADRPNILFILTEDQGAQMGFLGTPGLQTPHMDSLARSGMFFNNAFVVYPVCSASKAAIYTGLHNHANGILNNKLIVVRVSAMLVAGHITFVVNLPGQQRRPVVLPHRRRAGVRAGDEGRPRGHIPCTGWDAAGPTQSGGEIVRVVGLGDRGTGKGQGAREDGKGCVNRAERHGALLRLHNRCSWSALATAPVRV